MTEGYLIGTDWAVGLLRGRPHAVVESVERLPQDRLFLPLVALGELYVGAYKSADLERALRGIAAFVTRVQLVALDEAICRRFGALTAELQRRGEEIGDIDTLIAATALERGMTLLSNNRGHFERIPHLALISV